MISKIDILAFANLDDAYSGECSDELADLSVLEIIDLMLALDCELA